MSSYGILSENYWTGDTGRALRERGGRDAQLLGVYLLSNSATNMLGLYRVKLRDIEEEIQIYEVFLREAFRVLSEESFAFYDPATSFCWVKEMARFRMNLKGTENLQRDDNRVRGANRLYAEMPANPFLGPFYERYSTQLHIRKRRDYERPLPRTVEACGNLDFSTGFPQAAHGPLSRTPLDSVVQTDFVALPSPFQAPSKPVTDPDTGNTRKKNSGCATLPDAKKKRKTVENQPHNVSLITKIAHEMIENIGLSDQIELREAVKSACASRRVAYNSAVVLAAVRSAIFQRNGQRT